MYNPCHLIKSRHDIFYFRYPIGNKRISISLKTRCPKEALRLAKVLDYHSADFIKAMDWVSMDHADIIAMLKNYFSEVLESAQNRINKNGPLPHQNVAVLQNSLKEWKEVSHYANYPQSITYALLVMLHNNLTRCEVVYRFLFAHTQYFISICK